MWPGIGLVAVEQPDRDAVAADDPGLFVHPDPLENLRQGLCIVPPVQIVVPPYLDIARLRRVGIVEFAEQLVNGRVGDVDRRETAVFPELLGVAQLDVAEALPEVMLQRELLAN